MMIFLRYICFALVLPLQVLAQDESPNTQFWNAVQSHCGKAYEGVLELPEEDEGFGGKRLVMHVRSCGADQIKISFFVGEDKSRTWILSRENNKIKLQHDHRHEDGTEDEINFYGGSTTSLGKAGIQIFSADIKTQELIPAAASNIWWITINETIFTYNLRRLDTNRVFKVVMDLTRPIALPSEPWGWKE
jgi:hypothetical protein